MIRRQLRSPFPWFGSKRQVADAVWERLGEVANYVEPFGGSLAVLLANPAVPRIETVNDANGHVVNFWRAVARDPEQVARFADYPVTEIDLQARHAHLVSLGTSEWIDRLRADPDLYDAKLAGFWVWGVCASVGDNWLKRKGERSMPALSSAGSGVHQADLDVPAAMLRLSRRLRRVRVCCRDWTELVTPAITYRNRSLGKDDVTAVFLDPPYEGESGDAVYGDHRASFSDVLDWAIRHGDVPRLRIALCVPGEERRAPSGWTSLTWTPNGGYARGGKRRREQVWFNSQCLAE